VSFLAAAVVLCVWTGLAQGWGALAFWLLWCLAFSGVCVPSSVDIRTGRSSQDLVIARSTAAGTTALVGDIGRLQARLCAYIVCFVQEDVLAAIDRDLRAAGSVNIMIQLGRDPDGWSVVATPWSFSDPIATDFVGLQA
jgi:hypothetical protein